MASRLIAFLYRVPGGRHESSVAETVNAVHYKGHFIRPLPRAPGSEWTIEGVVSKQDTSGLKEHHFIRVEAHGDKGEAIKFSIAKMRRIINEHGDRMFDGNASVNT